MMNMKKLKRGQRGFTLVELVIVVALAGLVSIAITATAFQVFTFSTRISNEMTAIRQVQQAGFWVSPDVMMSEPDEINVNPGGGKFLVLRWQAHDGTWHEVDYILQSVPSTGVATLIRNNYVALNLTSTTTVAQYIDTSIDPSTGKPKTNCTWAGGTLTLTVTATVGGHSENRTYEVQPRVGS
jgi:prepilin-type N-terminal cleavage/methylation domain-containing protein